MSSIGTQLKEARNKKALSLEEVHSRTKIHPRVIQLLEEDKFDKLPSPLFVKSFLKSYAELLEINPEEMARAYEKVEPKQPQQVLFIRPAAEREKKDFLRFDRSLFVLPILVLGVLGVGGGAIFLTKAAVHRLHEKKAVVTMVKSSKTSKTESQKNSPETASNPDNWLRSAPLGNFPKIGKKEALHLKITAADNVWLRVTCDGKVLFQSILKRGIAEAWTANDHFEIWTGNASSMQLILNNHDLGSPGKGVTKKMIVNREGVRIAG